MQVRLSIVLSLTLFISATGCAPPPQTVGETGMAKLAQRNPAWVGTYRGVLPCADCPGIETVVSLHADRTYRSTTRYLGAQQPDRAAEDRGTFALREDGSITLSGGEPARYRVGENRLIRVALDGSPMTGVNAQHYVLSKAADDVVERYWKLTELRGKAIGSMGREPHLILHGEGQRVTGFAGCNSFTGQYSLDSATSRTGFSQIAMTRKFCFDAMDVEREFSQVLNQADSYSVRDGQLTLNRARMAPLARFEAVYLR